MEETKLSGLAVGDGGLGVAGLSPQAATMAAGMARTVQFLERGKADVLAICPTLGQTFGEDGRFQALQELGAGGMGLVLRAMDTKLGREVAVKFLYQTQSADEDYLSVLRAEAMATAQLNHENIVGVFDLGSWQNNPFLVMEYIDGEPLDDQCAKEMPSPRRALEIMTDLARGLSHAHERGIVHRDLKPSNMFIRRDGRAKILDFGIAVFENAQSDARERKVIGTPPYMAPEQWLGARLDARTDIWAAGVILFELLAGKRPFDDPNPFVLARRVTAGEPVPKLDVRSLGLPGQVETIVKKALARDPADRFQTAAELLDALLAVERELDEPSVDVASRAAGVASGPEVRPLTFLCATLRGAASLEEDADAEEVRDAYAGYTEICARGVRMAKGTFLGYAGGRVLACFGYPAVMEDDAARAARAAVFIRDEVAELGRNLDRPLSATIGVHAGLTIVENQASGLPLLHGAAPAVAGQLADSAGWGAAVVSARTEAVLRGIFRMERGAEGAPAPPDAFELVQEVYESSRFTQAASRGLTDLVGRKQETATLMAKWEEVKQGHGRLALVSGEAGIGKSRLLQVVKERLAVDGAIRMTCQCWPYQSSSAFYPIIDLLLRAMNIRREDPAEQRLSKIEEFTSGLGLPLAENVALVASLLSVPVGTRYPRLALTPVLQKERTLALLKSMLGRIASRGPVLFVVEDAHWIDPSSLEVVSRLSEKLEDLRVFFLISSRPEFRSPWPDSAERQVLRLSRMDLSDAAALVERLAGDKTLPRELVARLAARTEGVPLFIEELARVVIERFQAGERVLEALLPEKLPVTLHDLLVARLDRIDPADKELAQLGAVMGKSFSRTALVACATASENEVSKSLDRLVDAGLLEVRGLPPSEQVEFRHALIQEAAYQSILKGARQGLHRRIAVVFEEKFRDVIEMQPELAARHHLEAENSEKAIAYYTRAGELAVQRSANVEAINHYQAALQALSALPASMDRTKQELRLQIALGTPLMSTRGFAAEEVQRTFAAARTLCGQVGDSQLLFPVVRGLWYYYFTRGDFKASEELALQMTALGSKELKDADSEMVGHRLCGATYFVTGRLAESVVQFDRVMAFYKGGNDNHLIALHGLHPRMGTLSWLLWSRWYQGLAGQSEESFVELRALVDEVNHAHSAAFALGYAAAWRHYRREPEEVFRLADEAIELCKEHRLSLWLAWATTLRGWALVELGRGAEGIPDLKRGLGTWRTIGSELGVPYCLALTAEALVRMGQIDQASSAVEEGLSLLERTRDVYWEPELHRLRGEIRLRVGAPASDVEAPMKRALALSEERGARALALRAASSLARLYASKGRAAEARDLLRPRYEAVAEGQSLLDMREAKAMLDDLSLSVGRR